MEHHNGQASPTRTQRRRREPSHARKARQRLTPRSHHPNTSVSPPAEHRPRRRSRPRDAALPGAPREASAHKQSETGARGAPHEAIQVLQV
eukprot:3111082-Prymnesium_polylepis.2